LSDKLGALLKLSVKAIADSEFGQLLTEVDRLGAACLAYKELLNPKHCAFRIGVTGPPGAGKSSLIGKAILNLQSQGLKVGVLAIDPSSPFSKGAILGDRIRYSDHSSDQNVFIRSLGTRGSLGGLSSSSYLMLRAFDHVGFDVVIVETVGVGQTELEIMNVADHICVVLVPESGDSIQAMKAGLIEIADSFVVNKADRPGADSLVNELKQNVDAFDSNIQRKIFSTVATNGDGVAEVVKHWLSHNDSKKIKTSRNSPKRLQAEAFSLSRTMLEAEAKRGIKNIQTATDLLSFTQRIK
jgi:LAO/AO transport system kinase